MTCNCWIPSLLATWLLALTLPMCLGDLPRLYVWLAGLLLYVVHGIACVLHIARAGRGDAGA